MKLYIGSTKAGRRNVMVRDAGPPARVYPLELCLWIRNHSPDGFNWGYGGSGPAQLALALLWDVFGSPQIAEAFYQRFKREVVAAIRGDDWRLWESDIRVRVQYYAAADEQQRSQPFRGEG